MNVETAQRLADLRRSKGFSQEGLARKLGLSRQAVSKWERAESSPDTENLISLAKLYGVSLDELLNPSDEIEDDIEFETLIIDFIRTPPTFIRTCADECGNPIP